MSQFAIQRTGDANYPRHLNILVMGPPKSGKTTFISTAPNVVVAACEAGLMSIAHKDIPYVNIDSTEMLQNLYLMLSDASLRKSLASQVGLPDIETVAIDTLDAWQEMLKKEILVENRRTTFQRDDWGTLKERMAAIIKAFVALPINVIFTVHTDTSQDEEQRMVYAPGLQGSIKNDLAGFVDFSLLSFRQRETDTNGQPVISYYLKNEGDLKNPHLGNRAAGRLPEICAPEFKVLHDAVFAGVPTRPAPQEVAPTVSQPEASAVPEAPAVKGTTPVAPEPTGVPVDDSENPINAAGVTMLRKQYTANGLAIPEDLESWTLGKGRFVARTFVAWKADMATGVTNRDEIISLLQAQSAFAGEMEGVQIGTAATAEPVATLADAEKAATEVLGATVIGRTVEPDAKCEECGGPVDDPDIARLALTRYKRVLCVSDYKAETHK